MWSTPIFINSGQAALRAFSDEINSGSDSLLAKHPKDFELWHIGYFDQADGTIENADPQRIARGMDIPVKA